MTRLCSSIAFALLLAACGSGGLENRSEELSPTDTGWKGSWAAAPHMSSDSSNLSLRMIVRPTLSGEQARIRLSNHFGEREAIYENVTIARRSTGPAVDADSLQSVLFSGQHQARVAAGQELISDPIEFPVRYGEEIAVSFYVSEATPLSYHGNSVAVGYSGEGDLTMDAQGSGYRNPVTSFFGFMGLDVQRPDAAPTLVALGDSITDGGNPPEINNRWPDYFADRVQSMGLEIGILNEGIGANQVTRDTEFLGFSEAAVTRFERDVLQRPNVGTLILFEGTNDLAGGVQAQEIFDGLADMAQRAREAGIRVIIGTITPRGSSALWANDPSLEEQRVLLNQMLRDAVGREFDALADFDAALANPVAPTFMATQYDSGDGLHPNPLGLQAIAETVPIEALASH